ncbi:MAG: hypothetical protein J5710_09375 [Treponema sp.]|nr:hypothetical protein [Treponema sp.]
MFSKKIICQIFYLTLFFLPLAAQTNKYSADEAIRFNKKIEAKGYQSDNPLNIFYRKTVNDGISWRKRDIKYNINDKTLSKEKLMSTIWLMESNTSWMLLFYADDYFAIGWGDIVAFGKYEIKNNKLILSSFDYNHNVEFLNTIFTGQSITATLSFNNEHFYFANELNLNGTNFCPDGCIKSNGDTAVIEGTPVIVEQSEKTMSDNVRFRTGPSTKSKTQNVGLYYEIYSEKTDTIKKGTKITTYARTINAETIDGVKAYWYYISIPDVESLQFGWVFGGYFTKSY